MGGARPWVATAFFTNPECVPCENIMLRRQSKPAAIRTLAGALLLCILGPACRTTHRPKGTPVFFPADRDHAKLQFLTRYSAPPDLERPPSRLLSFLVGELPPKRGLVKPYGLCLFEGQLFVCDTVTGTIHQLDLRKREWNYFRPEGPGRLGKVINLDIAGDGHRYVTDTKRGQVLEFDAEGGFVGSIGEEEEMKPSDVKVRGDHLFVADLKSHQIRIYDRHTRAFLKAVPSAEDEEKDHQLFAPTNLDLGPDGSIFVSDSGAFRVQQYDAEGAFVRSFGKHGDAPGSFARNKGVAVDPAGRVYVVDAAFQNAQIFDATGRILLHFGGYANPGQGAMNLPASVIIDRKNLDVFRPYVDPGFDLEYVVLVTNQYGGDKVNVYGFLRKK